MELHLRGKRYSRALENCEIFHSQLATVCMHMYVDNAGRLSLFEERLRKRAGSNGAAVRAEEEEMAEEEEEENQVDQEEVEVSAMKPTRGEATVNKSLCS